MKAITFSKIAKILFLLPAMLTTSTLFSQEEEESSKFSISGSIDAYFRTNFNGLNKSVDIVGGDEVSLTPAAPATSFANDPGFAIGMANVILGYEGDKVGFVADLVFGPRGEDAVFFLLPLQIS